MEFFAVSMLTEAEAEEEEEEEELQHFPEAEGGGKSKFVYRSI